MSANRRLRQKLPVNNERDCRSAFARAKVVPGTTPVILNPGSCRAFTNERTIVVVVKDDDPLSGRRAREEDYESQLKETNYSAKHGCSLSFSADADACIVISNI